MPETTKNELIKTIFNYGTPAVILVAIMVGAHQAFMFAAPRVDRMVDAHVENWRDVQSAANAVQERESRHAELIQAQTEALRVILERH